MLGSCYLMQSSQHSEIHSIITPTFKQGDGVQQNSIRWSSHMPSKSWDWDWSGVWFQRWVLSLLTYLTFCKHCQGVTLIPPSLLFHWSLLRKGFPPSLPTWETAEEEAFTLGPTLAQVSRGEHSDCREANRPGPSSTSLQGRNLPCSLLLPHLYQAISSPPLPGPHTSIMSRSAF